MKVALYVRVSSEKQAEKDLSIVAQLKALREYAGKHGWTVVTEFKDEAESARTANRPAFQEMIGHAKRADKPFDAILIWKFSRFARNREDAIIYKALLRKRGVSVISMNEQIEDSPAGKMLEGMIEVMDEFYSANLGQDTIRGLKENASRGFLNGCSSMGYKAKKVMDGNNMRSKSELDETYAPIIKRIFKMSLAGLGLKEIAKTLNAEGIKTNKGKLWSNSIIGYILKNETYTGTMIYNRKSRHKASANHPAEVIRLENNHTAIISREDFESVQKLVAARSPKIIHPRSINSDYLLSGLLYCGKCGSKLIGSSAKSGRFAYYTCSTYAKKGKKACDMKLLNQTQIENLVIDRLRTNVLTEQNLTELFNIFQEEAKQTSTDSKDRLESLDRQLEGLKNRLGKLYNSLESGKLDVDDLAPRIKEIKGQIEALEAQKAEVLAASQPQTASLDMPTLKAYVQDLADLLKKGSIVEQRGFLRSFVKRIDVNHPQVTIEYLFPLNKEKAEPLEREVLPINKLGSLGWTRTSNPSVNSRMLHH